jgi:hypothetical protein
MTISFNPSELGMIYLGNDIYQINASDKLEDKIVIFGHLPFKLVGISMLIC